MLMQLPPKLCSLEPKLISQGAEALAFDVTYNGQRCVAKYRPPKSYRIAEIDTPQRSRRTRLESRVLAKLAAEVAVPKVLHTDTHESVVYMEFLEGPTLKQATWDAQNIAAVEPAFCSLGKTLALVHDRGVVHGDLTTSNVILTNSSVSLIDFGLAGQSASVEDKAVDLYVLERAIASTHPTHAERLCGLVLDEYARQSRHAAQVLGRLETVRMRGRKRSMVG